jgi:transcriptional regulator with GAF, ATPase, and Fis domain
MNRDEFQLKHNIIGKSKAIKDLVDIVMQVAQTDISVLITGESGVGKEIFANSLHSASLRQDKKIVSVNCGAIPEGILESELFGHQKGSFTGAIESRKGYFEIADGGTLFLDELAEMPLTTQVKLLRVLETGEFMRLGSEYVTKVDVRLITATNKDLQKEVDQNNFRKDLYFRLKAVSLSIPPLRERREDIAPLINKFLAELMQKYKVSDLTVSSDANDLLINYYWPGNARELKNVLESAAALSKSGKLQSDDFVPLLSPAPEYSRSKNLPVHISKGSEELDREMIYRALIEIKKDLIDLKQIAKGTLQDQSKEVEIDEVIPMDKLEKRAIINALSHTKWNRKEAARLLGIGERTLYRKLKEYDIR